MHCNETRKLSKIHSKYEALWFTSSPTLQINRKIRKGSKQTKLKQNHTHDLIKATVTMKTADENILEITKALKLLS